VESAQEVLRLGAPLSAVVAEWCVSGIVTSALGIDNYAKARYICV